MWADTEKEPYRIIAGLTRTRGELQFFRE